MGLWCGHLSLTRAHRLAPRGNPRHTCDCLPQGARPLCPQHGRAWPCPSTALWSPVPPRPSPLCARWSSSGMPSVSSYEAMHQWAVSACPPPAWTLQRLCGFSSHCPDASLRVSPPARRRVWHLPHAPRVDISPSRAGPLCLLSKLLQGRGERQKRL